MSEPPAGQPPRGRATRVVGVLTLAALSAITGIISYQHGLQVARAVGNTGIVALLVPLVPDLMIIGSSLTLMEAAAIRAPRPKMAVLALVAGIGWTVAQNVAAGLFDSPGAAVLAGGIPLAFVATFECLLWLYRRWRAEPAPAISGHLPPLSLDEAIRATAGHLSKRRIAEVFECSRARVDQVLPPEPRVPVVAAAGGAGA